MIVQCLKSHEPELPIICFQRDIPLGFMRHEVILCNHVCFLMYSLNLREYGARRYGEVCLESNKFISNDGGRWDQCFIKAAVFALVLSRITVL